MIEQFDFIKLPEYQFVREIHNEFVGKEIVVEIVYEGSFTLEILKPKFDIKELLKGEKRTVDYDYNAFKRYDLSNLDLNRKIYKSVSNDNLADKELRYLAKLLKENTEILKGDLTKLKWRYRFLKRIWVK